MRKSLSSALTAVLVLAAPLAGIAQNTQKVLRTNEHPLNIPGATTIEAPPLGFDPIMASDQDLAFHGFPPRPDQNAHPREYARWARAMKASKTRIVPTLEQTTLFHGPAQHAKAAVSNAAESKLAPPPGTVKNALSYNWSGYVDVNAQTSFDTFASFYYTQADFVVPYAEHPIGTCSGGWFWGSEWTGFDGWYTSDVVQAGVEFDSYCGYPTSSQFYSAWYEWYPNGEVRISNFPINAGDDIFLEVWNTSATQAWLWMVNLNNDQVVEIGFNPPAGVSMIGNSAEWVVERPNLGSSITTLTNYVDVPFWDVIAEYRTGAFSDISGAYEVDML